MVLLSNGTDIQFAKMNSNVFYYPNGDYVTFPIYVINSTSKLILDSEGVPVCLLELKQTPSNTSLLNSQNVWVWGGNKYSKNNATYGYISNGFIISLDAV